MMAVRLQTYDYRRGAIEVIDSGSGAFRCSHCGAKWHANPKGNGKYWRGSWTCPKRGATSKSKHQTTTR